MWRSRWAYALELEDKLRARERDAAEAHAKSARVAAMQEFLGSRDSGSTRVLAMREQEEYERGMEGTKSMFLLRRAPCSGIAICCASG